jgi:hypothetical protein
VLWLARHDTRNPGSHVHDRLARSRAASAPKELLMEYVRLGRSGLRVSRIALGCMSFGDTSRGFNEWSLNEADSQPFFKQAVELGVTFWDRGPGRHHLLAP